MMETWASIGEVAKHSEVAQASVYRWTEARGLFAHKISRPWRLELSVVDKWIRPGGTESDEKLASKLSTMPKWRHS